MLHANLFLVGHQSYCLTEHLTGLEHLFLISVSLGLLENTPSQAPSDNTMQTEWSPKVGPLMTAWSSEVSPEAPHPEYPRPQLVREEWSSLNGIWEFDLIDQ